MQLSEELLTTSAAARELGCSEATVREYDRKGVLPAIRASNGQRLFTRTAIEARKASQASAFSSGSRNT